MADKLTEDPRKGHEISGKVCCATCCEVDLTEADERGRQYRQCKESEENSCSSLKKMEGSDEKNCGCVLFRLKITDLDQPRKKWERVPITTPPTPIDTNKELTPPLAGQDRTYYYACFCMMFG
jgi:hypothetical protein